MRSCTGSQEHSFSITDNMDEEIKDDRKNQNKSNFRQLQLIPISKVHQRSAFHAYSLNQKDKIKQMAENTKFQVQMNPGNIQKEDGSNSVPSHNIFLSGNQKQEECLGQDIKFEAAASQEGEGTQDMLRDLPESLEITQTPQSQRQLRSQDERQTRRKQFNLRQNMSSPYKHNSQEIRRLSKADIDRTQGRWSKTEHEQFILALSIYGKDWKKVESFLGTRSGAQIRSHAQKFFNRVEKELNQDIDEYIQTQAKLISEKRLNSNTNIPVTQESLNMKQQQIQSKERKSISKESKHSEGKASTKKESQEQKIIPRKHTKILKSPKLKTLTVKSPQLKPQVNITQIKHLSGNFKPIKIQNNTLQRVIQEALNYENPSSENKQILETVLSKKLLEIENKKRIAIRNLQTCFENSISDPIQIIQRFNDLQKLQQEIQTIYNKEITKETINKNDQQKLFSLMIEISNDIQLAQTMQNFVAQTLYYEKKLLPNNLPQQQNNETQEIPNLFSIYNTQLNSQLFLGETTALPSHFLQLLKNTLQNYNSQTLQQEIMNLLHGSQTSRNLSTECLMDKSFSQEPVNEKSLNNSAFKINSSDNKKRESKAFDKMMNSQNKSLQIQEIQGFRQVQKNEQIIPQNISQITQLSERNNDIQLQTQIDQIMQALGLYRPNVNFNSDSFKSEQ